MGCGLSGRGAAAGGPGQLVDPHPRGCPGGASALAADRAGVAADVRAVAQPDREAVAVAAAGRAEVAPPGGRLGGPAAPGQPVPGPVRRGVAGPAPLRGADRRGKTGPGPAEAPLITD